jgi:hypothetical protein
VRLVEFGGGKRLIGFAGLTRGQVNDETKDMALQRARLRGFLDTGAVAAQEGEGA